ncbi:MAG: mercuric transporter MerT family protein [Opitutaceae bacterium]
MKKNRYFWTLTGGVFAGIAASLCCIGPLVALSLGLGSFAASAWFAQWRPVFLGLTFVLLGLAWYLTYRKPKVDCEDGSCARPPGRAARVSLWLGTLVAVAAAIYPSLPVAHQQINAAVVTSGDAQFAVLIPSMDCPPCAAGIEASLARAPGVKQAVVNYDTKQAVLVYDPTVTNRDELLSLIDHSGFPADRSSLKSSDL